MKPLTGGPPNSTACRRPSSRPREALVIDKDHRLRYRGAIDQYTPKTRKEQPTRKFLCEALDAVLAGKEVAVKATPVAGCPIERAEIATPSLLEHLSLFHYYKGAFG